MLARSVFRQKYSNLSEAKQFERILIANRGEIACRVSRTAKRLGIKTVGIFSTADEGSVHTNMCDTSYCVGPPPSKQSYLNMDRIIEVAKKTGAQAIHPGYGFLSENPEFADKVNASGLSFIGPPSKSMKQMASKSEAKKIMQNAGVPVTPGYHGEDQSIERLKSEAQKIGFPVMIKAVLGGGGKGMRIVENASEFEEKLESAKRESTKHFADDRVILEKYIKRSRHIEVQVFADKHGNAVYLYERDCSVQRRHQKIIEEAPAPGLSEKQRKELGEKAVAAAKAVDYEGAGTVEFLWDCDTNEFFFMEMNTRLQVEHPITEVITDVDLVQWQLDAAAGNKLPRSQAEIKKIGHAIEARIYAENTDNNFMPDTGNLRVLLLPESSATVRVEIGLRQGDDITVYYDPMIAKIIASGNTRIEAINQLSKALEQLRIVGVRTNAPFIQRILENEKFRSGPVDTSFIKENSETLFMASKPSMEDLAILSCYLQNSASGNAECGLFGGFIPFTRKLILSDMEAEIGKKALDQCIFSMNGESIPCSLKENQQGGFRAQISDTIYPNVTISQISDRQYQLIYSGRNVVIEVGSNHSANQNAHSASELTTPMPCTVFSIPVVPGQKVKKGDVVAVLEAMKMEHVLKAPADGIVKNIFYKAGSIVAENQKLVEFVNTA